MKEILIKIKDKYKRALAKIGSFNLTVILTFIYFLILPIARIFYELQQLYKKKSGSAWTKRAPNYKNQHEHQF